MYLELGDEKPEKNINTSRIINGKLLRMNYESETKQMKQEAKVTNE